MNLTYIQEAHTIMYQKQLSYYAIIFHDDLCNSMGEDDASIRISADKDGFILHFQRVESGVFDEDYDSRLLDEYIIHYNNDELLDYLTINQLLINFKQFIESHR